MVRSAASTATEYLLELEPDRRDALTKLRARVKRALPPGFEETVQYGMISYVVPSARLPRTYNGQPLAVLSFASQKQHMALYLFGLYGDATLRSWFERCYAASGKRLDMGKSCVRFKKLEDLALDVVEQAIAKVSVDALIAQHDATHTGSKPSEATTRKTTKKKKT